MRYLINDDDFEDWLQKLEWLNSIMEVKSYDLEYVIEMMKDELRQHTKIGKLESSKE